MHTKKNSIEVNALKVNRFTSHAYLSPHIHLFIYLFIYLYIYLFILREGELTTPPLDLTVVLFPSQSGITAQMGDR